MKKIAILQSNYIPWKGYFDIIDRADVFVFYDEVQYTKNDWRNRNLIKTSKGLEWLTIPVRQVSLEQKISETQIALPNWQVKHWNTIRGNYSKAPFFKEYEPQIKDLYLSCTLKHLSEINKRFIKEINDILGIKTEIIDSTVLNLEGDKNEKLIDAVKKLGGSEYLSGPAAKTYIDEDLFLKNGIRVEWMDYSQYPEYTQLYPPFKHNVTVLDLIFNLGAISLSHIREQ